jgi:hypothetical protein
MLPGGGKSGKCVDSGPERREFEISRRSGQGAGQKRHKDASYYCIINEVRHKQYLIYISSNFNGIGEEAA